VSGYEKSPDYGGHDHPFADVVLAIVVSAIIIGFVVFAVVR
jgi:hypothetical protein